VLVVLKTPSSGDAVHAALPHLDLTLAAHATDAVPQASGHPAAASGKHDLSSQVIPARDAVEVIAVKDRTYVIWKTRLHLNRPRTRLQRPAIYFTANINISHSNQKLSRRPKEKYLKSLEPLPENILEPLRFDPSMASSNVYLSESRITKVAPKAPNLADLMKPIRGATKRAFPAVPAIFTRIRYSTLPDTIIASLHLETSPLIAGTVSITKAKLDVSSALVEDLTKLALPLETYGGDETILLHKILPRPPEGKRRSPGEQSSVTISLSAEAYLDQGSHVSLEIDWQASIDLSHTWQKPTYRWSRPISPSSHKKNSLSIHSISKPSIDMAAGVSDHDSVTFSITGPDMAHAGAEFKLAVHCNNRSSRPRRFGLIIVRAKKASSRATLTGGILSSAADPMAKIFNTTTPDLKAPDTIDLNPDFRIGPLPPDACFETHLTFKALRPGVLDLGCLRIVDLDSRQTVDVRELPDVIALDRIEDPS
jgi:hypothetical protein